ncbi:hypothetical protein C8024_05880 [Sphingopyxis sp. BSNA05]|nr:hypothetical protein [Sphingopyxis sp. BSNA05]
MDDRLITADIIKYFLQIDFLMISCATFFMGNLTGNRYHTGSFALSVVKTIDQVQRARTNCSGANTNPTSQMRLSICSIGCIFFMSHTFPFKPLVVAHCFEKWI